MGKPTMLGGAPFPQKTLADELRQAAEFYNDNKYKKKIRDIINEAIACARAQAAVGENKSVTYSVDLGIPEIQKAVLKDMEYNGFHAAIQKKDETLISLTLTW